MERKKIPKSLRLPCPIENYLPASDQVRSLNRVLDNRIPSSLIKSASDQARSYQTSSSLTPLPDAARLDNSEWMRNGDYAPNRFQAQCDAINLACGAKTQEAKEESGSQSDVNKVLGDQSFVSSILSSQEKKEDKPDKSEK